MYKTNYYRFFIFFIIITLMSSCATYDPYTGEKKVSKSTTYGVAGAVVCGIIGATKDSKHARNAALGCGAIGAGIGAYMDSQEAELRRELEGSGVRVVRQGNQIQLVMPGNITFNTDEYSIKANFYPVLDSVAKVLYKYRDTNLEITGYTDSVGTKDYNMRLSENRAASVKHYLASRSVDAQRLKAFGQGELYPIADNMTESGRQQDRRVELYITAVQ